MLKTLEAHLVVAGVGYKLFAAFAPKRHGNQIGDAVTNNCTITRKGVRETLCDLEQLFTHVRDVGFWYSLVVSSQDLLAGSLLAQKIGVSNLTWE